MPNRINKAWKFFSIFFVWFCFPDSKTVWTKSKVEEFELRCLRLNISPIMLSDLDVFYIPQFSCQVFLYNWQRKTFSVFTNQIVFQFCLTYFFKYSERFISLNLLLFFLVLWFCYAYIIAHILGLIGLFLTFGYQKMYKLNRNKNIWCQKK